MEVVHTTGDRALDEEINRILARMNAAERSIVENQKATVVPSSSILSSSASGAQGVPGLAGAPGQIGPPGESGQDGDYGPPGIQGIQGVAGASGVPGVIGPALFLVADAGEEGSMGPPGPAGSTGAVGATGATGTSLLYTNQSIPVGNTITSTIETAFTSSYTFVAPTFVGGDLIVIRLAGVYSGTVLPTIRGKVKFGSVALIDTTAFAGLVTGTNLPWFAEIRIIVESPGIVPNLPFKANAIFHFATAVATAISVIDSTAATNIDVTVDQAVTVTIQWGAGGTGQTITLEQLSVQKMSV